MLKQLVAFTIGALLYAGFVCSDVSPSYISTSDAELSRLEAQYDQEFVKNDAQVRAEFNRGGPGSSRLAVAMSNREQARLMRTIIHDERSRRSRLGIALALAGFSGLLAVGITVGKLLPVPKDEPRTRRKPEFGSGPTALASPPRARAMTPAQAAELLGVPTNAPRSVVELALQTQLAARDPSTLTGLDPESQNYVLQQCEELKKASHILLNPQAPAFKTDAPRA